MRNLLAGLAGLAFATSAAAQGRAYSVTVIDSTQLQSVPTGTPISALVGKVPGGRVVASSNDPGTSPTIYLRGAMASVEGDPLIVIDGVVSLLNLADITTGDVERIEIVNGAVGGATYGVRGANGVVAITTRRGRSRFSVVRSEVGQTSLPRHLPTSRSHAFQIDGTGNFVLGASGNRQPEPDGIQDNPYPAYYDLPAAVLRPRAVYSNYVAQGAHFWSGRTRVAASASEDRDGGVLARLDGYSRTTGRFALDQSVTKWIDLSLSAFGARGWDAEPSFGSPFMQLMAVEPNVSPDSAVSSNPYYMLANDLAWRRERSGWSVGGEYRPLSWLFVRASTSRDRAWENALEVLPDNPPFGEPTRVIRDTERQSVTDASLGARRSFRRDAIRASARFTFTDETHRITDEDQTTMSSPPGSGLPPTLTVGSWSMRRERIHSYAFGSTTEIGDRITLDGHLRKDQTGPFVGTRNGAWYSRLAAGYTLGATRLHAATGTAAPRVMRSVNSAPLIFCPIFGPCGSPTRMPHAREVELGVAHRFRERYDVGYTLARQRTTDLLFLIPSPSSTGFVMSLRNAATTIGLAHELTARARVVSTPTLAWDVNLSAHRVRVKIKDMMFSPLFVPGAGDLPFRISNGETLGAMYGVRSIRTEAELLETLQTGQLTGTVADFLVNEEGYYVRAADWRTPNERPLAYLRCVSSPSAPCLSYDPYVKIGDANPDVDLGINTSLRWNSFTAYATVSGVFGGNIFNDTRRFAFFSGRDPVFDQTGKPAIERKPVNYYYGFASSRHEMFVESGTFVKLSELALEWRLPLRYQARVGIVGRNLFTSSRYSGYDPDVASGEPGMFGFRVDGSGYPAYRTVSVRAQLAR